MNARFSHNSTILPRNLETRFLGKRSERAPNRTLILLLEHQNHRAIPFRLPSLTSFVVTSLPQLNFKSEVNWRESVASLHLSASSGPGCPAGCFRLSGAGSKLIGYFIHGFHVQTVDALAGSGNANPGAGESECAQ